eukprot:PITA_20022
MYLVNTRPDICYAVNQLSQAMVKPTKLFWKAGKHVLRYLRGTSGYGLWYKQEDEVKLCGFTDAYWAGSPTDDISNQSKGVAQDVVKDQSTTIQRLESKILSLKEDPKESKKQNKEALKEQEHEVLELRQQVEEGRKAEENIRKQYLEKEEQHQVEVNILKGKLEEKDKLLRFQDNTKILDDILSSQRSPAIKTGLGFY